MIGALIGLVLFAVLLTLVAMGIWAAVRWEPPGPTLRPGAGFGPALGPGAGPARLPARERAGVADAIAHATWTPAHDEVDGVTRVLVRRAYTGLDGRPVVLDERVLQTFPATDPMWEAQFTEAMSAARLRCAYLNAEESSG